jgi:hypothetical protein
VPVETRRVGVPAAAIHIPEFVEPVELGEAHRRVHLRHLGVDAVDGDVALPGEAEVAEATAVEGEIRVVGRDRATLDAGEPLGGMEAEDLCPSEGADGAPVVGRPDGVSGVVEHRDLTVRDGGGDAVDVAWTAPEMHRYDQSELGEVGLGKASDPIRVERVAVGVHVEEHGSQAGPHQWLNGAGEGPGGDGDRTRDAETDRRDEQAESAVGDGDDVADPDDGGQPFLELLHEWPVVRQSMPVEHLVEPSVDRDPVDVVRRAGEAGRVEGRTATVDGHGAMRHTRPVDRCPHPSRGPDGRGDRLTGCARR